MNDKEKTRINAFMDLKDDRSKTYVLTSHESLLRDIDTLGLNKTDTVYIFYSDNNHRTVENWYYSIDGFPVKFTKQLEKSRIAALLEELKRECSNNL